MICHLRPAASFQGGVRAGAGRVRRAGPHPGGELARVRGHGRAAVGRRGRHLQRVGRARGRAGGGAQGAHGHRALRCLALRTQAGGVRQRGRHRPPLGHPLAQVLLRAPGAEGTSHVRGERIYLPRGPVT
eukprot:1182591-Prorocentrum_minimum.AAC.1